MENNSEKVFRELEEVLKNLDLSSISENRKIVLQVLINFVQQKINSGDDVNLNFICTHNSRRSHFSQAWGQAISAYFDIPNVNCYSGGTEATALYSEVAKALQVAGFRVYKISETDNPVYSIKFGPDSHPVIGFSKPFDHPFNPDRNFAAIMTCSQADADCPFIPGAEQRISLPMDDPKEYDNTPQQAGKYKERSIQIASELFYVFSKIKLK